MTSAKPLPRNQSLVPLVDVYGDISRRRGGYLITHADYSSDGKPRSFAHMRVRPKPERIFSATEGASGVFHEARKIHIVEHGESSPKGGVMKSLVLGVPNNTIVRLQNTI